MSNSAFREFRLVHRLGLILWIPLLVIITMQPAHADKESAPEPFIARSAHGTCYFKLVCDGDRYGSGHGAMYLVKRTTDTLLYTTEGWYASDVIVADWNHIARVVLNGRGNGRTDKPAGKLNTPPDRHVALGFYEKGKLLKEYTVDQLVSDRTKLRRSVSHYTYFKSEPTYYTRFLTKAEQQAMHTQNSHGHWVLAETVDGRSHAFNMYTGERCEDPRVETGEDSDKVLNKEPGEEPSKESRPREAKP